MKKIHISLRQDQAEMIERLAAISGMSTAAIIRDLIDVSIDKIEEATKIAETRQGIFPVKKRKK